MYTALAVTPYTWPMPRIPLPRLLAVLCVVVAASLARAGDDKDSWYIVEMLGQRAGWMHSTTATKDEKITSATKMHLEIKRGEATIRVAMESTFVETASGKPVSMSSVESLSAAPITKSYTFKEDGSIELVSEQNGTKSTHTLPKP